MTHSTGISDGAESTGRGGRRRAERPLTPAGARVLETASRLFYEQGLRAVGVEAIADEAGVTKKTLYDRFGSKDDLILAYLRARDELWRSTLVGFVEEQGGTPVERLLASFRALDAWQKERNQRGCAFVNAHVELPEDHPGQRVAREQKAWMLDYFEGLAADAGAADPGLLARQLLILHEGACIAHSMKSVDSPAVVAEEMVTALIERSVAPTSA
ncbi:TetR/AcrR family transcriptional regulator [Actinomadura terrae]|uniref:TetR/AcrR family transcriptional regulator n=1 Tax=Actinomadura terrae TaxID=604353 RepID=UPI001FA6E26D|nr:TetR/AcrR family transcriptional regulator [Actinomadura terrae]